MRTHTPRVVSVVDAESYVAARFPQSYLEMADDGMIAIYDAVSGRLVAEIFPDGKAHIYDADGSVTYVDAHGRVEGREDVALASSIPAERVTEFVFSDDEAIVVEGDRRVALENGAQRFAEEPPTRGRLEPVQEVVIDGPVEAPPAARISAHEEDDEITTREVMPAVEPDERGDDGVVASSMPVELESPVMTEDAGATPLPLWSHDVSAGDAAVRGAATMTLAASLPSDEATSIRVVPTSRPADCIGVSPEPALPSNRTDSRTPIPAPFTAVSSSGTPSIARSDEGQSPTGPMVDNVSTEIFRNDHPVEGFVSRMIVTSPPAHARSEVPLDLRSIADAIRERVVVTVPGSTRLGPVEFGVLAGPATIPVMRVSAGEVGGERRSHVVIDPSSRQGDPPDHRGSDNRHHQPEGDGNEPSE